MIPFNIPPYVKESSDYIAQAIANRKICGDGPFTKRCNQQLEEMTGACKALLTTSGTSAMELAALLLLQRGYRILTRNFACRWGEIDIIAEKDGIRYAIQCKCYSSDLGNKPIQEVNTGKMVYRCQIGVVMTNRYFTKGAKEAAEATGILLCDRDALASLIEKSLKE